MTENSCNEYQQLSRRKLLGQGALLASSLAIPLIAPRISFAQGTSIRDAVIVIHLQGGADALSFCCPHGDPIYYQLRPTIAIPKPGQGNNSAIDLDGYFGFPKAFLPLMEAFNDGNLGVIHAVGRENSSRSHFEEQHFLQAVADSESAGGWISRHLASTLSSKDNPPFRGLFFGESTPVSMRKGQQIVSVTDPSAYTMSGGFSDDEEIANTIVRMYSRVKDESRAIVRDAKRASDVINPLNLTDYQSSSHLPYPESSLGNSLRYAAGILKGDIGVEVIQYDWYGWDTHANQGSVGGILESMMNELARSMAAFYADMEASGNTRWTLVVMSEFGRQVEENGSRGTEHGTAGCMLTMGPNVIGGIQTDWPGLERENLRDGVDLRPTIDYRDVLADLVLCRMKNDQTRFVLPSRNVPVTPSGFFKAA